MSMGVEFDEYFLVVAEGDYQEWRSQIYPFQFPSAKFYHDTFERDISIGQRNETTTILVGCRVQTDAITCAHLFKGRKLK